MGRLIKARETNGRKNIIKKWTKSNLYGKVFAFCFVLAELVFQILELGFFPHGDDRIPNFNYTKKHGKHSFKTRKVSTS